MRPYAHSALLILGVSVLLMAVPFVLRAQSADELEERIEDHASKIEELEQEIREYEVELQEVSKEKRTLESAVRELDISRRKIGANISATQNRIDTTQLEISDIKTEIRKKEASIQKGSGALSETIRRINEIGDQSIVLAILNTDGVSGFWTEVETVQQFQTVMQERLRELESAKEELQSAKDESEDKHQTLIVQQDNLSAQKRSLDINRQEKDSLLDVTKEEESNYQALLKEKRAAKEAFEAALLDLESQLQYTLDPSRIPPAGEGILKWPLANVRITQTFGDTEFARSGAYNGRGHNGVDFGTPVGTPITAALSGKIEAVGDTDQFRGCYSYGKWMLMRHSNGLSTLYAHLSSIDATPGDLIATGQVIGYSGNTGYSTGPHLHFSVYQSDAVQVVRLGDIKKRTNCADARIPVAPLPAYLNPMEYL